MKRTYSRLSSELLSFDTEAGFMQCSVRVDADFTVEEYHLNTQWVDSEGRTVTGDSWQIGFDE